MELIQQFSIVLAVLGLLCGALWVLRKKGWARAGLRRKREDGQPRLEILDRLSLTPHHSLHLVRMADRTLLIGLSPSACNLLESSPAALSSAASLEH
jgi:flagellar biosynthetic protein FliO